MLPHFPGLPADCSDDAGGRHLADGAAGFIGNIEITMAYPSRCRIDFRVSGIGLHTVLLAASGISIEPFGVDRMIAETLVLYGLLGYASR